MADSFNTRLQFDWLGKSDRLRREVIQSLQLGAQQGANDRLQRDISQARNILEMRRQALAQQQFERRFEIDDARAKAYTAQVRNYATGLKRQNEEAETAANSRQILDTWVQEKVNASNDQRSVFALREPAGLTAKDSDEARDIMTGRQTQFNNSLAGLTKAARDTRLARTFTSLSLRGQGEVLAADPGQKELAIAQQAEREGVAADVAENRALRMKDLEDKRRDAAQFRTKTSVTTTLGRRPRTMVTRSGFNVQPPSLDSPDDSPDDSPGDDIDTLPPGGISFEHFKRTR